MKTVLQAFLKACQALGLALVGTQSLRIESIYSLQQETLSLGDLSANLMVKVDKMA